MASPVSFCLHGSGSCRNFHSFCLVLCLISMSCILLIFLLIFFLVCCFVFHPMNMTSRRMLRTINYSRPQLTGQLSTFLKNPQYHRNFRRIPTFSAESLVSPQDPRILCRIPDISVGIPAFSAVSPHSPQNPCILRRILVFSAGSLYSPQNPRILRH